MFKKTVEGKRATTVPCKKAYVCDKNVCRKPDIRGVSKVRITQKTSYAEVKKANVEGASVSIKYVGTADRDITLGKLFGT